MKIGIMGGTFDPIHNGHLMLGEYAYHQFHLDEVWFMPNGRPPHKSPDIVTADSADRLEMTRIAIADTPYFRLCSYEAERSQVSYSWETMAYLHEQYPEDEFFFIIGADSLFAIESWVHPERLIAASHILAAYRDDRDTAEEMNQQIQYLNEKYSGRIHLLKTPVLPVSSHEIRRMVASGEPIHTYVSDPVLAYIQTHHLYEVEKQ